MPIRFTLRLRRTTHAITAFPYPCTIYSISIVASNCRTNNYDLGFYDGYTVGWKFEHGSRLHRDDGSRDVTLRTFTSQALSFG